MMNMKHSFPYNSYEGLYHLPCFKRFYNLSSDKRILVQAPERDVRTFLREMFEVVAFNPGEWVS